MTAFFSCTSSQWDEADVVHGMRKRSLLCLAAWEPKGPDERSIAQLLSNFNPRFLEFDSFLRSQHGCVDKTVQQVAVPKSEPCPLSCRESV
jgi:hypothetical protein